MYFKSELKKIFRNNNKKKNLILCGGNSIKKAYKIIAKEQTNWENINIYLADERDTKKIELRNIQFLKKNFKNKNLLSLDKSFIKKHKKKKMINNLKNSETYAVIGMGQDGHFASIFYDLKKFKKIINVNEKPNLFLTEKIGTPFCKRLTMNLSMILLSTKIIIVFTNKKRIKSFFEFISDKNKNAPIYYLVKKAKNKLRILFNKETMNLNQFKKKYA